MAASLRREETSSSCTKPPAQDEKIERVDEAWEAFHTASDDVPELDEQGTKRFLRRIDLHLMPIMCIIYGLNFLDKQTLSYASVMGIQHSLDLKQGQYQWLASLFYFGYLAWEYPTSRLLQLLPLAKYGGGCIVAWGTILCCFAAVKDFRGAVALRFMLGVAESAVTPGFALLTSQWYVKSEQGLRTAIWFSCTGWAQILGGFIAYGIAVGTANNHHLALRGWQILFVATGSVTVVMGIVFVCIVPDSPLTAWWLTKEQRTQALQRIRVNQQGVGNKHFKWYQKREALTDPMTLAFAIFAIASNIPNGGIGNFFGLLITSFGYTAEESLLYSAPAGAFSVLAVLAAGYFGDRYNQRLLISVVGLLISELGIALMVGLDEQHKVGKLIGYYLLYTSLASFVALLSLISSNIAGYTKKTTVAAIYLIGYCVGNLVGPQTFRPSDAPNYVPALVAIIVCWAISIATIVAMYFYWRRQNTIKAKQRAAPNYSKLQNTEWLDLTDRENTEFEYRL